MRLTVFLMAEYAAVSQDGKLSVDGSIDEITISAIPGVTPELPDFSGGIPIPPAYLVAQTEFSLHEGLQHTSRLLLRDADGHQVIPAVILPPMQLVMNQHGRPMRHNAIMRLAGLVVPGPGDYVFEYEVNGKIAGETPLYVTDRATRKGP
jgi:hypothetical protein